MDYSYTYDGMLRAIKDGARPEDIAKAFTDNLNNAIKDAKTPSRYEEACNEFASALNELLDAYETEYEVNLDDVPYVAGEDVKEYLPRVMNVYALFREYTRAINNILNKAPVETTADAEESFEKLIDDLLGR